MSKPLTENQKRFIRENYRTASVTELAKHLSADPTDIRVYIDTLPPELDLTKKRIFTLIVLLLPIFFVVLFETGLRISGFGGNMDLFISAPEDVSDYMMCNRNVGRRYFFMQATVPKPTKDLFLKTKPKNGYRVFVLGGSTAAGFPYGNNVTFSRILSHRLSDTFPDKRIEIVNVAMSAINSYTLVDFVDEILENEPDAILIYAGHNEFYGALGVASMESLGKIRWFVKAYLKLERFKTFLLVRNLVANIRKLFSKTFHGGTEVDPTATLMERIVAERTIPYRSAMYESGKNQFEKNLRDILKKCKDSGIPVLVSELVSNIRDQEPFISERTDSLPSAESMFRLAQTLEKQNKFEEARKSYYRAKDLDALRFRAPEEFNTIIHRVADQFSVPVVPMKTCFEKFSPNGLIGNNLMVDHLHPNIDGYFLMAEAFFESMRKYKFIEEYWNPDRIRPSSYYREHWGFTELDTTYAALCIRYLKGGWPFQPKSLPNRALDNYHPSTRAESLSVRILVQDVSSLEVGHLMLGEQYEKQGQYQLAFEEYNALIYMVPHETLFHERAAKMLIKLNQFDRALSVLFNSLKYKETEFANKWIGQILLIENKINEAIPFLEKANKMQPNDSQLLYNLTRAYLVTSRYQKAQETWEQLKKISPHSPYLTSLERDKTSINVEYLKKADALIKQKQFDQALSLLYQSLLLEETALAYERIGQILLLKGDQPQKAILFLEKARQSKPDDPHLLYSLSTAYLMSAQYKKAQETLKQLEELDPHFPDPSNLKGKLAKFLN